MPFRIPVGRIDIRVFAHATEDADKVLTAVHNVLPLELIDVVAFKRSNLSGHHGNPIMLFEARIKERSAVQAVFEKLSSGLGISDKEQLSSEVAQHLDKGSLYVRLDKQSAFLNKLKLSSSDPIHFRIHFKKHTQEEIIDFCRKSGLLP